jgi:hypothetical protein
MTTQQIKTFTSTVPFDAERIGAAAVYCSDGRYGDQMDEFLHRALGLPRYDRVAAPGGPACAAGHSVAIRDQGAIEKQLRFLITAHELDRVVLIAHQDCGFYQHLKLWGTTVEQQQRIDMAKAAQVIRGYGDGLSVEAYFARKVDGKVRFERVDV